VIRDKDYIKSKFETGDIPTQEDYSDFIDSCYNLSGVTSGETVTSVIIPETNFLVKEYIEGGVKPRRSEKLMSYWTQNDLSFLEYNPKVWLYRYKNNKKKLENSDIVKHKKVIHTPHLNGINYPNSSFYSGSFFSPVKEINDVGVHTEFDIGLSGNTPFDVSVDPYDWVYMNRNSGGYKLNDSLPLTDIDYYLKVMGRPKGDISFLFRLAITIDDPNGGQQRLVGPMSGIIALRLVNGHFIYQRRFSDISKRRFNM